jgi:UDP-N-acetylglucosamine 2-epimerase
MLSRVIGGAISLGGWKIITEAPSHMLLYPGGVVVASTENPLSIEAAAVLATALNEADIFTQTVPLLANDKSNPDRSRVYVIVGTKPDPADLATIRQHTEANPSTTK